MDLKTYRAHSMADALAEVKKDLGGDAVILHTRSYKVGGVLGVGARQVVEITASNSPNAARPRQREGGVYTRPTPQRGVSHDGDTFEPEVFVKASMPAPPPRAPVPAPREQVAPVQVASSPAPAAPVAQERASIEDEIASLKKMMAEVLQTSRRASGGGVTGGMPPALFDLYLRLIDRDIDPQLAEDLAGRVRDALSPAELEDAEVCRATLLRRIAEALPVRGRAPEPGRDERGRPRTIALVGPTGVGKTTTVAKLAASYKLRQGCRVGLITSDTYRIAAVEQLRTYANIIGLPLKVVLSPSDVASACADLAESDVILIDTAGRSPNDGRRLDELHDFVEAAQPHERHLVLSATSNEGVLLTAAERFSQLEPDHVIFTKLDEAEHLGTLVNVLSRTRHVMSFVTTGQEVPDDLAIADADRIARMVLDGGVS